MEKCTQEGCVNFMVKISLECMQRGRGSKKLKIFHTYIMNPPSVESYSLAWSSSRSPSYLYTNSPFADISRDRPTVNSTIRKLPLMTEKFSDFFYPSPCLHLELICCIKFTQPLLLHPLFHPEIIFGGSHSLELSHLFNFLIETTYYILLHLSGRKRKRKAPAGSPTGTSACLHSPTGASVEWWKSRL